MAVYLVRFPIPGFGYCTKGFTDRAEAMGRYKDEVEIHGEDQVTLERVGQE